jgi:type VI protein secretion system component VasF
MGRYIEQTESRSELQQRIAAELRARAEANSKSEQPKRDEIEDSAYMEGTKRTTTLAPVWLLIFFAAIVVFAYFFTQISH